MDPKPPSPRSVSDKDCKKIVQISKEFIEFIKFMRKIILPQLLQVQGSKFVHKLIVQYGHPF